MKKVLKYFTIFLFVLLVQSCDFGNSVTKKKVTYYIDDELVSEYEGNVDEEFVEPTIPFIERLDKYEWKKSESVNGDTKIIRFDLDYTLKTFIVTFYDQNNVMLKYERVNYGESATAPVLDERLEVTWDQDFTNVTDFLEVHASVAYKYYYIEFYDTGKLIDTGITSYVPGEELELPVYNKEGYSFLGWYYSPYSYDEVTKIESTQTGDIKLYARFVRYDFSNLTLPDASYHFTKIVEQTLENGTSTYYPENPLGQSSQNFKWTTSDSSILLVSEWSSLRAVNSGYCVLTATSKSDPSLKINALIKVTSTGFSIASIEEVKQTETVKVTFKGYNDEIIKEYNVRKGFNIIYPMAPYITNKHFVGWSSYPISVNEDVVISALYEDGENEYTSKSYALIGDSISTYYAYQPFTQDLSYFYPYPTADLYSFNQTWWMRTINGLGGSLFFNNSYSGTCVASGSTNDSSNPKRLALLVQEGHYADITMIFMGSNDCASKISVVHFEEQYRAMIDEVLRICPNTKVVLYTLPISKLYNIDLRDAYNECIKKIAGDYGFDIIDISSVDLQGYTVDSAHPNNSGMELISDAILKQILK